LASTIFITLVASINAAPAVIWKKSQESSQTEHISQRTHISSVISSTFSNDDSSLDVFFLVGRDTDGSEALSTLASSGALSSVASRQPTFLNHHVDNIESAFYVSKLAKEHLDEAQSNTGKVLEISLSEFNEKLEGVKIPIIDSESTTGQKRKHRRAVALDNANKLIVKAKRAESKELDAAVGRAIDSKTVGSVILAGQRSNMEVKEERNLVAKRRMAQSAGQPQFADSGRRRLEDADDANNNNNDDLSGVYYVNMTPNIFAGLLFTFMFLFVVQVGIGCLGNIQGPPDLYVSKYPSIGREA